MEWNGMSLIPQCQSQSLIGLDNCRIEADRIASNVSNALTSVRELSVIVIFDEENLNGKQLECDPENEFQIKNEGTNTSEVGRFNI